MDLSTFSFDQNRRPGGYRPAAGHAAFIAIAALIFFALLMVVHRFDGILPGPPGAGFSDGGFVWYYGEYGVDYNMFRLNLFGEGQRIRDADILLYASSKGIYGFRTDILSKGINKSDAPQAKLFNASLAWGEGLAYLGDIVRDLDLHRKIFIIDLSVQASIYFYSGMAQTALTEHTLTAYESTFNLWLRYCFDRLFQELPVLSLDADGWKLKPRPSLSYSRSWLTGDDTSRDMQPKYPVVEGRLDVPFDTDGRMRKLFDDFKQRDIEIIFTSIPTGAGLGAPVQSDPVWSRQVAAELGLPYVMVDASGLYTSDTVHLDPASADLFSERLGKALAEPPIAIADRLQRLHRHEP
jgi:hypothetical protein